MCSNGLILGEHLLLLRNNERLEKTSIECAQIAGDDGEIGHRREYAIGCEEWQIKIVQLSCRQWFPCSLRLAPNQCLPKASITAHASTTLFRSWLGGHTKRPRSNLFWKRHRPSPSNHKSLIESPRFPLNTNTCPENGACSSTVSTMEERPLK